MKNVRRMIKIAAARHKAVLLGVLGIGILGALYAVVSSLMMPALVYCIESHRPMAELVEVIVGFGVLFFLCDSLGMYMRNRCLFGRIDLRSELIDRMLQKTFRTSYPNVLLPDFQAKRDAAFRVTGSNSEASEYIWTVMQGLLEYGLSLIFFLVVVLTLPVWIVGVVLAATAVEIVLNTRLQKWRASRIAQKTELERIPWYLIRDGRSKRIAKDVRLYGFRGMFRAFFERAMEAFTRFYDAERKRTLGVDIAGIGGVILRNGAAYAYLIHVLMRGTIGVAEFLLYFSSFSKLTSQLKLFFDHVFLLQRNEVDLAVMDDFERYPEMFSFEGPAPDVEAPHEIVFSDVGFRYPESEHWIFRHVDFRLNPGEKLAVVGKNGAGKTTLIKILAGFLEPTEGRVLLDGQDIRTFDREKYYRIFTGVFQTMSLLPGSIRDNILQSEPYDEARYQRVLELSGFADKIRSLPKGDATKVGTEVFLDGVELSGGELQKLMLARALYRKASILLLDEPTAALDPLTENEIYQKYRTMVGSRSAIFISHRLASTHFCDRILLLGKEGIEEEGTHAELMQRKGEYARLFDIQSRYYRDGKEAPEEEMTCGN